MDKIFYKFIYILIGCIYLSCVYIIDLKLDIILVVVLKDESFVFWMYSEWDSCRYLLVII